MRATSHAAAAQACGPADGPAVSIYLTSAAVSSLEPAAPYVRIDIPQPLDRTIHGTADLHFPTQGRVRGEFTADWNARQAMCG